MKLRGADLIVRGLVAAGTRHVFTLSGNHIMPVFDAAIDTGLGLVHVRHEAAAVHMADAWGRITGEAGVALVTGGPGHANAIGALYTALASDSPVVLLSGHAPLDEIGRGSFQEMRQTELARPIVKGSWIADDAASIEGVLARAFRTALAGRPGPVHVSLPSDVLESVVDAASSAHSFRDPPVGLDAPAAEHVMAALMRARRPLVVAGCALTTFHGRDALRRLEAALQVPVVGMESPRGVNDPALGAVAEVLGEADTVLLLGKQRDFTLKFGKAFTPDCQVIDPGSAIDAFAVLEQLIACAAGRVSTQGSWLASVREALAYRPPAWAHVAQASDSAIHPLTVCRAMQRVLAADDRSILVCDGGEFGQWVQAAVSAPWRLINGPAGSIGAALPFALAAKLARPDSTVIAAMGDGTFGFHMAELDTAVRYGLPLVAVVGNDARWNAEYQIQVRTYGVARALGCELRASRYDQVAVALGGHGEHVTAAERLPGAIADAVASGLPACLNVPIEGLPAPVVRR